MIANQIRVRARLARVTLAVLVLGAGVACGFASSASAAVDWTSEVYQAPTNLSDENGRGMLRIIPENQGNTAASDLPTVSFTLPQGVTLTTPVEPSTWSCSGSGSPQAVTCSPPSSFASAPAFSYTLVFGFVPKYINLMVDVAPGGSEGTFPLAVTLTSPQDTSVQTHQLRVGGAPPPFGPTSGSFTAGAFDQAGADYTQAGGHPHSATSSFDLNTRLADPALGNTFVSAIRSQGSVRDVVVDLPAGFVGDPSAGPKCPDVGAVVDRTCPVSAQVGVATIAPTTAILGTQRTFAIYNIVPPKDAPAQFGFLSPIGIVLLKPVLRSDGDLGISAQVRDITQADGPATIRTSVTLWGVPADPSHDSQRCNLGNFIAGVCTGTLENGVPPALSADLSTPHAAGVPLRPFLTNPTECTGQPLVTSVHLSQYEVPRLFEPDGDPDLSVAGWVTAHASAPPVTGCDKLKFDPGVGVKPTSAAPGSPTGLDFDLRVPQNDDPNGLATAHVRNAKVALPEGMTVNPSSANGLDACGSGQIGLVSKSPPRFTKLEPSCPQASKIGTVEVMTPLLDDPLAGEVFLARQTDNPFDSLLAIYIVVRGPGLIVKLAGHVEADPQTGQLSTTVTDNPQLPFDELRLRIKSGPRAPLTAPSTCGIHTTMAAFTSWAGHSVDVSDPLTVNCPGNASAFDPSASAGSSRVVSGAYSPVVARVTRDAGKELGRINVTMPPGVLANVKHVDVCSEAQIASSTLDKPGGLTQSSPSCPTSSQIGTTTVGAGAGPTPFFPTIPGSSATGRVFLSAPHANTQFKLPGLSQADYGLVFEVPAVAGPFDLGTVTVRAAIYFDQETGRIHVVSDRLPRILRGIVLNVRDVRVNVDRAGFSTTPSRCAELRADIDVRAQDETLASRSSRYQVGECAALRWNPRLALRWVGRTRTTTGTHPGINAVVRQSGLGEAGIRRAEVRLPKSLALDPDNAQALCEFEDGTKRDPENHCPKGSIVGEARAVSPLLKRPLFGKVFFVKNVRIDKKTGNAIRTLPMIVVALRGEVDINLKGKSSVKGSKLVNTFANVPDAPISRFDLYVKGGKSGILVVTRTESGRIDVCSGKQVADAVMNAQNGRRSRFGVRLKTPCGGEKAGSKRRKASRR